MKHLLPTPVGAKDRILSLDVLRGIALLGILIINIQSFAMPGSAYLNPSSYGDLEGVNYLVWLLSFVFADSKMMTIFSVLFGAGIILVTEKTESKTGTSAGLHYRRSFWLLIFGLIHAHLIWHGDILVSYAICAFIAYLFRKCAPRTLVIIGLIIISIHTIFYVFLGTSMQNWPDDALADVMLSWAPDVNTIQEEIVAVTSSVQSQISHNSETATFMQSMVFPMIFLWRAWGLMLIGMALYKWGILSNERSHDFYKKGLILGCIIGFPIVIYGVYQNFQTGWSYKYSMFQGSQFNYWGSLGVSYGYICGIMLIVKSQKGKWIQDRLAAVGQMAFTNYIAQSIICTFIFWAWGLGLFGQIERWGQLLIVLGVWLLQILWSRAWLNRYRFGPIEWLWRSLSYWRVQPMSAEK